MIDLEHACAVEVKVGRDGKLWVNIDGQCALRIQSMCALNLELPNQATAVAIILEEQICDPKAN